MSLVQKLTLRRSELRVELAGLLELEQRSEDQENRRSEIGRRLRALEADLADALRLEAAGDDDPVDRRERRETDAEDRERERLRSKFSIARVFGSLLSGRLPDGVEAEYGIAEGSGAGSIPLDVFERREEAPELERRAVTVTPGVAGPRRQRPIVPPIFDRSVAPWLGIAMPMVRTGDSSWPVLTTAPTAGVVAKDAAAPQTAGAFTVQTVQPRRLSASFAFRVEDAARLEGMESSLRSAMMEAISDQLDNQCLNGDANALNTDGEIRGLIAQLGTIAAPANNAETWARYNAAAVSHIDGLYAVDEMGIGLLVGEETYRHMAQQFRATESNESFSAYWQRIGGGIRATRRMPAPSSNIQTAVIRRSNPTMTPPGVMPAWSSLTIRDIYSTAREGQIQVTALALVGDLVLLRGDVFEGDSFRLA